MKQQSTQSSPQARLKTARAQSHGQQPRPGKENYMLGKTKLACNVGNILLALSQEPQIANAFGYDEMQCTEVLLRPLFGADPKFKRRPVTDADVTAVQAWLQWFRFPRLGSSVTLDAINKHARKHAFHPVRDYLNGLKWDGTPRLATWLNIYFGAEQNEYTKEIGTMFLIGMVARVMRPGCKLDYMMVLEGDQGTNKSRACAILAGDEYFSDQLPDIASKDAFQHLRGKWLIEVTELRAYSRAAVDHFKEFLVRQIERYRPPYGRKEIHEPRQACFIGTTNKWKYLKDETGNRRFWPVNTGEIDIKALRRDRNQLFAEAVRLFNAGKDWWPTAEFERHCIAEEQEKRFEADPWESLIKERLDRLTDSAISANPSDIPKTTILDIAEDVLGYTTAKTLQQGELATPINRLGPKEAQRITAILHHLKWVPKRNMHERWWEPGPGATT
jgi:hypothetical protein